MQEKKMTNKEELIKKAKQMMAVKEEWRKCVRSGSSMSSLETKGIKFYKFS